MPSIIDNRPLTEKQQLWCKCMYIIGGDTFGNALESARRAGYKGSNNTLGQRGHELVNNSKCVERKAVLQAESAVKLDHNRTIAIKILNEALVIARFKKDSAGIVQACRELDAISNLHSNTVHTETEAPADLSDLDREVLRKAAITLTQSSLKQA